MIEEAFGTVQELLCEHHCQVLLDRVVLLDSTRTEGSMSESALKAPFLSIWKKGHTLFDISATKKRGHMRWMT